MSYRILVLIDHAGHSINNSAYALCRALSRNSRCQEVYVASRSASSNEDFFHRQEGYLFHGMAVSNDFAFDETGLQFDQKTVPLDLSSFDLVLLRMPHPISALFYRHLERKMSPAQILNRPTGIETTSSKAFLLQLSELCPPIRLCTTLEEISTFHEHYDLVLKPLRNYGGKGIVKVVKGIVEMQDGEVIPLKDAGKILGNELSGDGFLAMKFLKNVSAGDKRIVVVNGKILGAALRVPAPGSWLCNVSQGGVSERSYADDREKEMAAVIHDVVAPLGIGIFGMDTLLNDNGQRVLSEINTLSVGGVGPMEIQSRLPVTEQVADELLNFFEQQ